MSREDWAFVAGLIAMLLIASSYFVKKKSFYLLFQCSGIVFLALSYLLTKEYFVMIGLGIGLARSLIYFTFEIKDKNPSVFWPILFSVLSIAAYFIVNVWILQTPKFLDIIFLVGAIAYAFVFRIRNLSLMRYLVIIPTVLSVLYNVLIQAVPFIIVSYLFELAANLASIAKYEIFSKKSVTSEEIENEKD